MMLVPAVSSKMGPSTLEAADYLELAFDESMLVGTLRKRIELTNHS